jgi:phage major head subunit gpT-like protein
MANPMLSSQFVRLLDKRLREVSEDKIDELHKKESMIDRMYKVIPSDSAFEEFFQIGALPDIPEFSGKLSYLSISPGYYTKIEPKEYAGGVMFERKLLDDKKYAVLDDRAGKLANSAHRVREKLAVRPFAYAFSSAFDFMTSEEGVSLCSGSHTTKSGTSTSSGFSNSGTSALSKTSVAATRILMKKFRNDISERIVIEPDTLVVPDELYDTALEIVGTDKGLNSAEGTINVHKGRYDVIDWMRLSDYDTNNWWMVDSKLMKEFMVWVNRIPPEPHNTIDFETFSIKHSIYMRVANGFLDYETLVPTDGDVGVQSFEIAGKSYWDNLQRNLLEGRSETIMEPSLKKDDGIVRTAWQHAEVGRNDQLASA